MNILPDLPFSKNESEWAYPPGPSEQLELAKAQATHEVAEIPAILGGKEYFSNDTVEVRSPNNKSRAVARIHRLSRFSEGLVATDDSFLLGRH